METKKDIWAFCRLYRLHIHGMVSCSYVLDRPDLSPAVPRLINHVPELHYYTLTSKDQRSRSKALTSRKSESLLAVTPRQMVWFTLRTDKNVPIPGRVCLLCLALGLHVVLLHLLSPPSSSSSSSSSSVFAHQLAHSTFEPRLIREAAKKVSAR